MIYEIIQTFNEVYDFILDKKHESLFFIHEIFHKLVKIQGYHSLTIPRGPFHFLSSALRSFVMYHT